MDLSEELVTDVINFYYEFIRNVLSKLKSEQMNLEGLGIFKPRYWNYRKHIRRFRAILFKTDPTKSFKHAKTADDAKEKLKILIEASDRIDKALVKKNIIRRIQKDYDNLVAKGEDPFKKLEEDLRRFEEQDASESIYRKDSKGETGDLPEM